MKSSKDRIIALLQFGFCAKKIYFGENVIIRLISNKIKLMVLASDISSTQEKKYLAKAEYYNVDVIRIFTKKELAYIFNKNEVACVGLSDINMAKEIIRLV